MEKKLTNSGPLRKPADKHSIYPQDKLEWILLCDAEVVDFAQARECALQYSTRWVIEEYHKAIKTGLGAERLQLESAERLFAAVAIMSVVALRLIELRERLR